MPAANCFPLVPGFKPEEGAMLESLGVAIHTNVSLKPLRWSLLITTVCCGRSSGQVSTEGKSE
jgi:hypothetical protein